MAAQAREAAAWRAWELSAAAKGYSWASRAQRSCRSLALTPRPSIHRRTALLRTNCVVRIASSTARAWARVRRNLYSYASMRRLRRYPDVDTAVAVDRWTDYSRENRRSSSRLGHSSLPRMTGLSG